MKPFLVLALLVSFSEGQVKDAPTVESVSARREASLRKSGKSTLKPVSSEVEVRETSRNFMDNWVYLIGARGFALVPKGSVIVRGKSFKEANVAPENLPFMKWPEFIRSHRAGLHVQAVTHDQLQFGKSLESIEEVKQRCLKGGITCITTYDQNPVRIARGSKNDSVAKQN